MTLLIEKVENVSDDLESYSGNLKNEYAEKLNELKHNELKKLEIVKNDTLKNAYEEVAIAEQEGKKVGHCLETLKTLVDNSDKSSSKSFDNCVDNELDEIAAMQKNVETHLKTKKNVLEKLEHVLTSCKNIKSLEYQLCIAKELPSATTLAGGYYSSTVALKKTFELIVYAAPFKTNVCFMKPIATFNLAMLSGQLSINECISNA